jgi:Delta24-sterol reductase
MEQHDNAVKDIAIQVRQFYDHKVPFRIYHGSTNSTRKSQFRSGQVIDASDLCHVLHVDSERKFALVEPNVAMDEIVGETRRCGLIPPVVMEFPGITVGGGFSGTSGESSSFKYGFFDRTVEWIEIVLANGDIATASHTENADLFYGSACSFGTLGVITLLRLQLVEDRAYVLLTFDPFSSLAEAISKVEIATADSTVDYLDGVMFGPSHGVVCTGRRTNEISVDTHIQSFTRPRDPWFYLYATKKYRSGVPVTEAIPLSDYLFRYDRGAFWTGAYAFKYFKVPFNRITRYLLDPFMHTRVMYHALHNSGHSKIYVIQDIAIPYAAVPDFISYVDKEFGHYPLWLCPLRQRGQHENSPHGLLAEKARDEGLEIMMNVGIWGPGPSDHKRFIEWNQKLERKVLELKGEKWLYAHTYYTESEFWNMYDRKGYDELRGKYYATHLPSIYDKIKVEVPPDTPAKDYSWMMWLLAIIWSIWPLSGVYGVLKAALGREYLLPRDAPQSKGVKQKSD